MDSDYDFLIAKCKNEYPTLLEYILHIDYENIVKLLDLIVPLNVNEFKTLVIEELDLPIVIFILLLNRTKIQVIKKSNNLDILSKCFGDRYQALTGDYNALLNNYKLKTKFDLIMIDSSMNFSEISKCILNCERFAHQDTLWYLDQSSNSNTLNKALVVHRNKFIPVNDNIFKLKSKYTLDENKKLPTIVTALYDIRSLENNNSSDAKNIDHYIDKGTELLSLEIPMIIYTEEKLFNKIRAIRPVELHAITQIIIEDFTKSEYFIFLDRIKENLKKYNIQNLCRGKDTPLYFILNCNKFYWMNQSIHYNFFDSTHFVWIDFGISRLSTGYTNNIRRWIQRIPDKIRQMEINPYLENTSSKEYFRYVH